MYCITKNSMKFGEYYIPARTKAKIINIPIHIPPNAPGIKIRISIDFFDMFSNQKRKTGVPANLTKVNNELENKSIGNTDTQMIGITLLTNTAQVYLGYESFAFERLYNWQVKKVFNGEIPDSLPSIENGRKYSLDTIIEYLEEEFADWVQNNCQFRELTEEDIEDGIYSDGAEVGDRVLSDKGYNQFKEKQLEYKKRLENTGFTYEFKGGLVWS